MGTKRERGTRRMARTRARDIERVNLERSSSETNPTNEPLYVRFLLRWGKGLEWLFAHIPEYIVASTIAWSLTLFAWYAGDNIKSMIFVLNMWRQGWPLRHAMKYYQKAAIVKFFEIKIIDLFTQRGQDAVQGVWKQLLVASFICVGLCPIYLKYLLPTANIILKFWYNYLWPPIRRLISFHPFTSSLSERYDPGSRHTDAMWDEWLTRRRREGWRV